MNPLIEYPRTADLAYWINEREAMRQRKEAGVPAPWTTDPEMANVRYCNVHREDDKVTRYIRNSAVYSGLDIPTWRIVLARMVNRISSLEAIAPYVAKGDLHGVKSVLRYYKDGGTAIWGNAYTISTCGKSMDKIDYVIDHVVDEVRLAGEPLFHNLQECHAQLMRTDGLGSFLAAQVVADLKNTGGHPLSHAPDWWTWAAEGPGSLKGLQAYYGTKVPAGQFRPLLALAVAQTAPFIMPYVATISAQDWQNCFCEFSKYIRVHEGGHARNRYDPSNYS